MKFGQIPTLDAAGAILAHSQKLPGGRVLKKGHVLTGSDLDDLLAAGRVEVIVALPAPDDIGEDMVAAAIAAALCGDGLRCAAPFTGRCNLVAGAAGLVHFTPATIHALNQVDEAITLATLPPFARVAAGDLVATVKVIPFAVPRATVEAAMHSIGPAPVIRLAPFRPLRAALIQTTLPGLKPSILAGTVTVTAERLSGLGATLAASSDCPHEQDALAADLSYRLARAELERTIGRLPR